MSQLEKDPSVGEVSSGSWAISFLHPRWRLPGTHTWGSHWRWTGKGTLAVNDGLIELRGYRRRFLCRRAGQHVTLNPSQIRNVAVQGHLVRFEAAADGARVETVRLAAADPQAAETLVQALPKVCTPEFARARAFTLALRRLGTRSRVTPVLIAVNVLVYLAMAIHDGNWTVVQPMTLIHWGSNFGPTTLSGDWWRLFSSMFLHFAFVHLLLNMCALAYLGFNAERLFGSASYALLYLFAGLSGNIASLWWHPWVNSAGASGAIFGVIGGLVAFAVKPATGLPIRTTAIRLAVGSTLVLLGFVHDSSQIGIDNAAHLGGLMAGLLMGWLLAQPPDRAARQRQPTRVALGAVLGAALLVALFCPLALRTHLSKAEVAFRIDVVWLGAQEARALDQERRLTALKLARKLTATSWGDQIAGSVVPLWLEMEARVENDALPQGSTLTPLRVALLAYLDDYRRSLALFADDARTNKGSERKRALRLLSQSYDAEFRVRRLLASNP